MKAPGPVSEVTCSYCAYGLTPRVQALYDRLDIDPHDPEYGYGPGHVVFEDENYYDEDIRFCIAECEKNPVAVRSVLALPILRELLTIAENERVWDED